MLHSLHGFKSIHFVHLCLIRRNSWLRTVSYPSVISFSTGGHTSPPVGLHRVVCVHVISCWERGDVIWSHRFQSWLVGCTASEKPIEPLCALVSYHGRACCRTRDCLKGHQRGHVRLGRLENPEDRISQCQQFAGVWMFLNNVSIPPSSSPTLAH